MKLEEFLAMMAFENATSIDATPQECGYTSWREMYDEVSEVDSTHFTTPSGVEIYLTEEESWTGTFRDVLVREYNTSAWVLKRAKDEGVTYE